VPRRHERSRRRGATVRRRSSQTACRAIPAGAKVAPRPRTSGSPSSREAPGCQGQCGTPSVGDQDVVVVERIPFLVYGVLEAAVVREAHTEAVLTTLHRAVDAYLCAWAWAIGATSTGTTSPTETTESASTETGSNAEPWHSRPT